MARIAACLYVLNAADDIQEWIAYHTLIGVGTFLIYDNGSTDQTVANALAMGAVADVRIVPWGHVTHARAQGEAYEDSWPRLRGEFDWGLYLDGDEFLVSDGQSLPDLLESRPEAAAIAFNWACFGSNRHVKRPPGLTTEAFTARSTTAFEPNIITKLVVRPDKVMAYSNPHHFRMDGPMVRPDGRPVEWRAEGHTATVEWPGWRVNHYFVRSREQWLAKLGRGYRDTVRGDDFAAYDRNEAPDATAARHAPAVRALIAQAQARRRPGG